jgi:hypothetical protein
MSQQQTSGVDLARAALAAARAAAKTRPTQPQKKTRRAARTTSRRPGDPMGLGAAITRMMTERGWQPPEEGGSILDQWPTIAPELADKVAAVRFEHDTGTLHLRPATHTYATQLRLYHAQILAKVQQSPSGATVRSLKILPPGAATPARADILSAPEAPREQAPVRTRATASPGYRATLQAALTHKPDRAPTDPYIVEAIERQERAARANRPADIHPLEDHRTGPAPGSVDASRAAALAFKRREAAGSDVPRRAFDVA